MLTRRLTRNRSYRNNLAKAGQPMPEAQMKNTFTAGSLCAGARRTRAKGPA